MWHGEGQERERGTNTPLQLKTLSAGSISGFRAVELPSYLLIMHTLCGLNHRGFADSNKH